MYIYRKVSMVLMMAVLFCTPVLAQEQKGSTLADWIKRIQTKISQIAPKKTVPQSTIVAGVRGAKEGTSQKLYWKGKKGEEPVTEDELKEFKEGLELAAKGDKTGAIHELEEFMKLYPDSALIPDVKKTLDLAKSEDKEEKK